MDSSYPRPITNWEGIPDNLDAATTYTNGKTYFFKGDKYYKFDDSKLEVARSAEEALGVARLHSCPVCLGRGLCQVREAPS